MNNKIKFELFGMYRILKEKIDYFLGLVAILFIKLYQFTLSPSKGILRFFIGQSVCNHIPDCSTYSVNAYKRYGFIKGTIYSMKRISKCKPSNKVTFDPCFYKIVFFCSAPIGKPFLEEFIKDKRFEVVGVVTNPDKPIGRGQKIKPNIIKIVAKKYLNENLIQTPTNIKDNDFIGWLKSLKADFFVVIAYGKIIPETILNIPLIAPINIHGSLLPYYRGASPIQSVLLDNGQETGITIMKMNRKMDQGNIISQLRFKIKESWTAKDIIEKMMKEGPVFTVNSLWKYGKGQIKDFPQDSTKATYCTKFNKQHGLINWNESAKQIYNKFRAFVLWPGIYIFWNKKKLDILDCNIVDGNFVPGKVYNLNGKIVIGTKKGGLQLKTVKLEGKKPQNIKDFINGYKDFVGSDLI